MASKIYQEAIEDMKVLKETAIENAKQTLVEALTPKIKKLVETQIGEAEEGCPMDLEKEEVEMEAVENVEEAKEEEEDKVEEAKEEEDEKMEETVEITSEDLKKAFSEVLKSELKEATVSKSFGAVQDPTPKSAGGKMEKGIADEKAGEHHWADEKAPAAKDWTIREQRLVKQNKALSGKLLSVQKENADLKQAVNFLRRNLQEVALFNSKLIHTNKVLQNKDLNSKQRIAVIEAFDKAGNVREVELVYNSISESLKIAGVVAESKKDMKGPKASRAVASTGTSSILRESRENENDVTIERMKKLAGLVK